jgi:hypothetical protein
MIDLPNIAAMVMGLDDWDTANATPVGEDRLLRAVQTQLGNQVKQLLLPPIEPETLVQNPLASPLIGVPVAAFPQWFRCPWCELVAPLRSGLFELKTEPYRPERARYVHLSCPKPGTPPVVLPSRFQLACSHGHLDDFPWVRFVHGGVGNCNGPLRLRKVGASDEAVDLLLKCDSCGAQKRMSDAFGDTAQQDPAFACAGRRPHLRDFETNGCSEQAETILLGASNSWFPITLSALSIPTKVDKLPRLIEERWLVLQYITERAVVAPARAMGNLKGLESYTDDEVWAAIEAHRADSAGAEMSADLKTPEWEVFVAADPARNNKDFLLRPVAAPKGFEAYFEKVVAVERLREVRALTAFTRIESPGDFSDPSEIPAVLKAPICRGAPSWVPVSEVRGEGIFLQFNEEALREWGKRIRKREAEFGQAHTLWRQVRRIPNPGAAFPGIRYALIHSLSHALMRQLSMEAGYTAASIRERIYAAEGPKDSPSMAGLLLYTAAPDSEGTLGGLVSLAEPGKLGRLLTLALEQIKLCASDPLCAEHHPTKDGIASLHGAACHACMFAPETSCERGNKYLDRSLLIKALGSDVMPFFGETQ